MRPSRDQVLMEMAHTVAKRSTCSRLQVGCVVSRDGRPLVTGYNGAPAGMPHCDHTCLCGREAQGMTTHVAGCPAEPCIIAVHDAANAIAYAARWGIELAGAEMHTTDSPCYVCAQLIINAAIRRVVWAREYRIQDGIELLRSAGIEAEQFPVI